MVNTALVEKLRLFGVGRRRLDDPILSDQPLRLGICDPDVDEEVCQEAYISARTASVCNSSVISSKVVDVDSLHHASNKYSCSQCKRVFVSPHLLDLHIQETHDSFFAVMVAKKPSYCCYVEECSEKFMNPEERRDHCVKVHKLPKDFRFDKPKSTNKTKKQNKPQKAENTMEVDDTSSSQETKKFFFNNNKQKSFPKYSGKKFTSNKTCSSSTSVNMDEIMSDLTESLPKLG